MTVKQVMTLYKFILCHYELISSVVSLLGLHARAAVLDTEGTARWRFSGTILYSRTSLIGTLITWIGLALRINLFRILEN